MKAIDWFDDVLKAVVSQLPDTDAFHADVKTMSLARGNRVITVYVTGMIALFAPSFTAGGSVASLLAERVQHLDPVSYDVSDATVSAAADAVIAHLKS